MALHTMFYNFQYNYGHSQGQSKFVWGVSEFDLTKSLIPQLIAKTGFDESEVFNPNLTSFNPVVIEQATKGAQ